jgi:hypothetical protein
VDQDLESCRQEQLLGHQRADEIREPQGASRWREHELQPQPQPQTQPEPVPLSVDTVPSAAAAAAAVAAARPIEVAALAATMVRPITALAAAQQQQQQQQSRVQQASVGPTVPLSNSGIVEPEPGREPEPEPEPAEMRDPMQISADATASIREAMLVTTGTGWRLPSRGEGLAGGGATASERASETAPPVNHAHPAGIASHVLCLSGLPTARARTRATCTSVQAASTSIFSSTRASVLEY